MLIKGYSDLTIKTPECLVGIPFWVARFKIDADVTQLFPYINAVVEDAVYYDKPHYIKFNLDGIMCALYPDNVFATPFEDRKHAVEFIDRLIDFLNDIYSRRDSLKQDHEKYRHLSVLKIYKLLPQTNCRECGFPSCMAFAAALSNGETVIGQCQELRDPQNVNAVKLRSIL